MTTDSLGIGGKNPSTTENANSTTKIHGEAASSSAHSST